MTPKHTAPDIFVEELSSRPRRIEGIPTGIAAFVGTAESGPHEEARRVGSLSEFEKVFGGGGSGSTLGPAVRAYFSNGGGRAWIVRVAEISRKRVEGALAVLRDEDEWDLLSIPSGSLPEVVATTTAFCERHKRFLILDAPAAWKDVQSALGGRSTLGQSSNVAVYYPWLVADDPGVSTRRQAHPPGGAVAGVFARTDESRGVWKAPAGTDANLRGVADLAISLGDSEVDLLNPEGINALRSLPQTGPVVWGARTLAIGASEFRYVSVRRTFLYLERSIERSTQWVVFEPNDEPLWATLRSTVESFLTSLFRLGAFAGQTQDEAFFVRCGRDTTTQADIEQGRVNLHIGFAALRPAEFVVLELSLVASNGSTAPPPMPVPHRGNLVLFAGPRGSGQLRTAKKLARDQDQTLKRVRPKAVLAQYIGETEKNLDRLFDQATKEGWVLFFDEADALFGKRSDVEDSHDRFANIEVSYLLRRIKRFDGTVIVSMPSIDKTPKKLHRRCKRCLEFPVRG
jgi:phage tail sheath protein FI